MNLTRNKVSLIHERGPYHIETIPFICSVNEWTGFFMIGTSVMEELKHFDQPLRKTRRTNE